MCVCADISLITPSFNWRKPHGQKGKRRGTRHVGSNTWGVGVFVVYIVHNPYLPTYVYLQRDLESSGSDRWEELVTKNRATPTIDHLLSSSSYLREGGGGCGDEGGSGSWVGGLHGFQSLTTVWLPFLFSLPPNVSTINYRDFNRLVFIIIHFVSNNFNQAGFFFFLFYISWLQ